jgi:glycerol kinase
MRILETMDILLNALEIRSSSEIYGYTILMRFPAFQPPETWVISGGAFWAGMSASGGAEKHVRTGCFMLLNTGENPAQPIRWLITLGYKSKVAAIYGRRLDCNCRGAGSMAAGEQPGVIEKSRR